MTSNKEIYGFEREQDYAYTPKEITTLAEKQIAVLDEKPIPEYYQLDPIPMVYRQKVIVVSDEILVSNSPKHKIVKYRKRYYLEPVNEHGCGEFLCEVIDKRETYSGQSDDC